MKRVENSGFMWAFQKQQCDFWHKLQDNSSSCVFPTLLTQHKLIGDSNTIVVLNSIFPLNALFFLVLLWRTNHNSLLLYIDHIYIYTCIYI